MARFRFRLEPLLKIRLEARYERRAQLAQAQDAQHILYDQHAAIADDLLASRNASMRDSMPGIIDVDRLLNSHRYELVLEAQSAEIEKRQEQLAAEIDRRHELLMEADREVKVLENLKEKKLDAHHREQLAIEVKQMDEGGQRLRREVLHP